MKNNSNFIIITLILFIPCIIYATDARITKIKVTDSIDSDVIITNVHSLFDMDPDKDNNTHGIIYS